MAGSDTVSNHQGASRAQRSFIDLQGWLLRQRFFTSTLLPAMPRQLRWALRRVYFAPVDLMERFRGEHHAMVPPYAERFTGFTGYDYINSGQHLVEVLTGYAGLQADSNMLDIGSGIGRLAVPLTKLITRLNLLPPTKPAPVTKPCPQCLSDIPEAATRCAFCTSAVA